MKTSIIVTLLIVGGALIAVPILFDALMMSILVELYEGSANPVTVKIPGYIHVWGFFTHLIYWAAGVVLLRVGIRSAKP